MEKANAWIFLAALLALCGQTTTDAAGPDRTIWQAAADGNLEVIRQYLDAGTDINVREPPGGSTPLLVAAVYDRAAVATWLVGNGADTNARSNDGATALHAAAFFCHAEIVSLLLANGAEVKAKNIRGETPLDAVAGEWSQEWEGIYNGIARLLNLPLDLERVRAARPRVAALLRESSRTTGDRPQEASAEVRSTGYRGILDRVSISPSETKVCFEYQPGFTRRDSGRTLYIADFDPAKPRITNAMPFANEEGADRWFAYPRWTGDEAAIVYHASPSLYLYTLNDKSTVKVSTNDGADYRYPHGKAAPKQRVRKWGHP